MWSKMFILHLTTIGNWPIRLHEIIVVATFTVNQFVILCTYQRWEKITLHTIILDWNPLYPITCCYFTIETNKPVHSTSYLQVRLVIPPVNSQSTQILLKQNANFNAATQFDGYMTSINDHPIFTKLGASLKKSLLWCLIHTNYLTIPDLLASYF